MTGIQIFQVRSQGQGRGFAQGCMTAQFQGVSAATSHFFNGVFQLASSLKINDVCVIACTAYQGVSTASTIKCVGKFIAGNDVIKPVASALQCRTCQCEVFDVGAQRNSRVMI